MLTKIFLRKLFCEVWLLETMLCVRAMNTMVLQHKISAPMCVQHTWLWYGTYRYRPVCTFYFVCIITYRYVLVCTGINWYILNTLFLYLWSRFQMWLLHEPATLNAATPSSQHPLRLNGEWRPGGSPGPGPALRHGDSTHRRPASRDHPHKHSFGRGQSRGSRWCSRLSQAWNFMFSSW